MFYLKNGLNIIKKGVFMKKIALVLLCLALLVFAPACKGEINLEPFVSEKRLNAYVYECEDFTITLYDSEMESPYISDGYVCKIQKSLLIRLENFKRSPDNASVKVNYNGEELSGDFTYNPINSKYTAEIPVKAHFVKEELPITFINGGEEVKVLAKRQTQGSASANKILSAVSKHARSFIESALEGGGGLEVRLRVIPDTETNYYYVGLIDSKGNAKDYLVDGKTLKIVAER